MHSNNPRNHASGISARSHCPSRRAHLGRRTARPPSPARCGLRRYRENAGYGLNDAARILECDRSKISRIETGQRGIRPKELRELLAEYGVAQDERLALAAIAQHNNRRGWWQSYEHVLSDAYQDYIIMESATESIWTYESQLIPGLLQTAG